MPGRSAAGEGAEEVVSDLLSPLAEATYRDESLAVLYRQLDPADLLYSFMIGAAISTLASGASAATGQRAEASPKYRANEAEYLNLLERKGLLPPESSKNAVPDGTAKENTRNLLQRVKEKLSSHIGKTRAQVIRSMSFGEQVADIESGLISRKEKPFANVRETTPEILVWEAGADPLPIIMSYESAFLSARSEGPQPGHYHKLGAELMSQIPEAMEHPLKIIRQKNGRIAEVLDLKDQNERKVFLSIELSAIKDVDGTHSAYNLIITAFGAEENYIERQLGKEGNTVLKK